MVLTSKCKIIDIKNISEDLKLLYFNIDKYIPWEPGMFMQLTLDEYNYEKSWPESRAFSFASYGSSLSKILIRKEGIFTTKMFNELKIGNEFYIKYAFGEFFLSDYGDKIFLASGAGISVFMSYIDYHIINNIENNIYIYHSIRNSNELFNNYYDKRIPDNIKIISHITQEKVKNYSSHRIKILDIKKEVIDLNHYKYYICGNDLFVSNYLNQLKEYGISNIFYENWNKNIN